MGTVLHGLTSAASLSNSAHSSSPRSAIRSRSTRAWPAPPQNTKDLAAMAGEHRAEHRRYPVLVRRAHIVVARQIDRTSGNVPGVPVLRPGREHRQTRKRIKEHARVDVLGREGLQQRLARDAARRAEY